MTDTRTRSDCKHCGQPLYRDRHRLPDRVPPFSPWADGAGSSTCRTGTPHEPVPVEFSGYDHDAEMPFDHDDARSGIGYDPAEGDEGR